MKAKWADMKFSSFLKGGTEILETFVGGEGGQFIFMDLNPIPGAPLVVKNDTSLKSGEVSISYFKVFQYSGQKHFWGAIMSTWK